MKLAFSVQKLTLDSILSDFQKTIDDLETLIEMNSAKEASNADQIYRLEDENVSLMKESHQANNVLKNLRGLINN